MKTLEYLDSSRLLLLPQNHWEAHEFCFFLHDNIARILVEYEASGIHQVVEEAFQVALEKHGLKDSGIDMLSFMKKHEMIEPYRHHLVCHLVMALTSDMLHFLYQSLYCFEKRKFSVGFSLLRKPFKENLLFLAWLLSDTDDFLRRFESKNYQTLNNIGHERQIEIFSSAIEKLPFANSFEAKVIRDIIYSKTLEDGFEPIWQRATHLITSQGELLKTEDYTINFIFNDPSDDFLFDVLYLWLPCLMMFSMQITLECFNMIQSINKKTYSHLLVITMGCYEALFLRGREQPMAKSLNTSLKFFLKCIHCGAPLRINRSNAARLYLSEQIFCKKCNLNSTLPLYWIFCKTNASVLTDK